MKTWILVADEARARLFEAGQADGGWVERQSFVHPEGRQHARDVVAGHLPRTQDSVGSGRHAIEPHTDLETVEARRFARELATRLEQGRVAQAFQRLALVAPPRFLGVLHATLGDAVERLVVASLSKAVTRESPEELRERLRGLL
jgi:protein required for attachment to host cells